MGAVRMRVGAELRSRWRASVALAVVMALALGVVLAAAAGARRTQTAYPRFLREGNAADFLISPLGTGFHGLYDRMRALPEVREMATGAGIPMAIVGPRDRLFSSFNALATVQGGFGFSMERPNLLAGRMPDQNNRSEVLINRFFAEQRHVSVGDRLRAVVFPVSAEDPSDLKIADGTPIRLRVAGIVVTSTDIVPANQLDKFPSLEATQAFYRSFTFRRLNFDGAYISLRPGADAGRFREEVQRLARADPRTGGQVFIANQHDQTNRVRRAIAPQAAALAVFALLASVAAFLVVAQLASRQVWLDSIEYPTLRSLGMTRRQLMAVGLARVALVASIGGIVGVAIAAAASSMFPIGPARLAETDPGFSVNVAILGFGFLAAVLLLVAVTAIPAWRAASVAGSAQGLADRPAPPSRLGLAAGRAGLPISAATGVRMAVEPGRGRTAVPVRSALAGLAVGVAAVIAASTFGTNLDHLVHDPTRYGWNWDTMVDLSFGGVASKDVRATVGRDAEVSSYSGGVYGTVTIGGTRVAAVGITPLSGAVYPTLIRGRNPAGPDEIVLGATTARDVHTDVGRSVDVQLPTGASRKMRVVGEAVFPSFGQGSFTPTSLGDGAEVVASDFPAPPVAGPDGRPIHPQPTSAFNFVLIRFREGVDASRATGNLRQIVSRAGCPSDLCQSLGPTPPSDIASYRRVVATPVVLSALLAALAAALMVHVLVTSVRRRRHDLAVLKTLGFSRRQVGAAVAWQATTLVTISLLVGVPLGVAGGRWAWVFFADRLGVGPDIALPAVAVGIAVLVALALANLIAALPGRSAARTRPALVLRTE